MPKASLRAPLEISRGAIAAHGNRKLRTGVANFADEIPSSAVGQTNIGDQDIIISLGNFFKSFLFRTSTPDGMSDVFEVEAKRLEGVWVVFHDKYSQQAGRFQDTRHTSWNRMSIPQRLRNSRISLVAEQIV